jgi:hypothetical protein
LFVNDFNRLQDFAIPRLAPFVVKRASTGAARCAEHSATAAMARVRDRHRWLRRLGIDAHTFRK